MVDWRRRRRKRWWSIAKTHSRRQDETSWMLVLFCSQYTFSVKWPRASLRGVSWLIFDSSKAHTHTYYMPNRKVATNLMLTILKRTKERERERTRMRKWKWKWKWNGMKSKAKLGTRKHVCARGHNTRAKCIFWLIEVIVYAQYIEDREQSFAAVLLIVHHDHDHQHYFLNLWLIEPRIYPLFSILQFCWCGCCCCYYY